MKEEEYIRASNRVRVMTMMSICREILSDDLANYGVSKEDHGQLGHLLGEMFDGLGVDLVDREEREEVDGEVDVVPHRWVQHLSKQSVSRWGIKKASQICEEMEKHPGLDHKEMVDHLKERKLIGAMTWYGDCGFYQALREQWEKEQQE